MADDLSSEWKDVTRATMKRAGFSCRKVVVTWRDARRGYDPKSPGDA